MATDIEQTPFMRQLVTSDRAVREKALESLRTYLLSSRPFTSLELLKLWKGLFFCMWHSDRPITQQRLALSLSHLVLPLPRSLFLPFLTAFWTTISREWTNIDAIRLDKFLLLVRYYVSVAFTYLSRSGWDLQLLDEYLDLVKQVPLSATSLKVSDGLRYHVLDVWVDELHGVDGAREGPCPVDKIMAPVLVLSREGKTKKVRERARETLEDERLTDWGKVDGRGCNGGADANDDDADDTWDGLDD